MAAEALNFNRTPHYGHAERYERANEFAEVVTALWDSWDDDAFMRDKASGQFFDPAKLHALNHKGKHFQVRGPLNVPRPPQGRPVIVQAGTSDDGMDVAARFAEVIFSAHLTMESCQQYFKEIKTRAHDKFGRNPDHLKVMPGLSAYVGRTEEEANEKFEYQNSLMHPTVAREILSTVLGNVDLTPYDFDGPLPENLPMSNASQSTFKYVTELAKRTIFPCVRSRRWWPARARRWWSRARRSRSPITWSGGTSRKPPTASTSCRRICPARSTTSLRW